MRNYTLWEERETESSISSHSTSYLCLLCKLLIISQSLLPFLFSPFVLYSNFWNKFCLIVSHLLHILPSLISISFYLCWSSFWSLFNLSSFLFPSMFSWAWSSLVISWTCVVHSLIFSPLSCSSLQFSFWISLTLVRSFAFYFFSLTQTFGVWLCFIFCLKQRFQSKCDNSVKICPVFVWAEDEMTNCKLWLGSFFHFYFLVYKSKDLHARPNI